VLMLCDPRLLSKPYGRVFLASLPAMTHTRSLADVQRFFDEEAAANRVPLDIESPAEISQP
jgi:ATP-dependent DNA helicase DinG